MTRKLILLAGTTLLATVYRARANSSESLRVFRRQQQRTVKTGMLALGGWAMANFVVSGLSLHRSQGDQRYFHQMNVLWNTVNATIAGLGYGQAARKKVADSSLTKTVNSHHSLRRKLLFNAGLDVAYVTGGFYLIEKAKSATDRSDRWHGYGKSLMLQGGFLLAFDAVLYLAVRRRAGSLDDMIHKLTAEPQKVII